MTRTMRMWSIAAGCAALAAAAIYPLSHRTGSDALAQGAPSAQAIDPKMVPPTIIGMNTGAPSYYSTEETFADPVKTYGDMGTEVPPGGPLTGQLKEDQQGHPIDVPLGTKIILRITGGAHPVQGNYHCTISPGWKVDPQLEGRVEQSGTRFVVPVDKSRRFSEVQIAITAQKAGIALTELSCRVPGLPADAIFRPDFLADMRPFRVLRFMDWMKTNNLPPQQWATRAVPNSREQIYKGVALEYMVALANELHADPWFTLPFDADPDYYRLFAIYVRDHLAPGLKAYVEYSNEVWNGSFEQAKLAIARGKQRYPGVQDFEADDYYYGDRVREVMKIWSDVFAGQRNRIVRVASAQAAWSHRAELVLGHKDTYRSVDALAIAPYFGGIPNEIPGEGKARVDGVLAKTPAYIDEAIGWAKANKLVANRFGLPLIAYEGGPGFFAFSPEMIKDVVAVSHDPRFYGLYQGFLRRWQKEIGGLLVLFEGTATGTFAHLDYTGQPLSEAPKMRAVVDFIATLPPDDRPAGATAAKP